MARRRPYIDILVIHDVGDHIMYHDGVVPTYAIKSLQYLILYIESTLTIPYHKVPPGVSDLM